jgi:hypothetical protein
MTTIRSTFYPSSHRGPFSSDGPWEGRYPGCSSGHSSSFLSSFYQHTLPYHSGTLGFLAQCLSTIFLYLYLGDSTLPHLGGEELLFFFISDVSMYNIYPGLFTHSHLCLSTGILTILK